MTHHFNKKQAQSKNLQLMINSGSQGMPSTVQPCHLSDGQHFLVVEQGKITHCQTLKGYHVVKSKAMKMFEEDLHAFTSRMQTNMEDMIAIFKQLKDTV